jgi:hypothetical protein
MPRLFIHLAAVVWASGSLALGDNPVAARPQTGWRSWGPTTTDTVRLPHPAQIKPGVGDRRGPSGDNVPAPTASPLDESTDTLTDLVRDEAQKVAWKKGDFQIVPYGYFWTNVIYASQRTNPGAYTLFVFSEDLEGEDAYTLDVRQTRLGVNVAGPEVAALNDAETAGRVEIDFHGDFVIENRPGVLLRHGYWEVNDKTFRFLVGQTTDVISPLIPGTLNYGAGFFGGNIGYRRAQVRLETYHDVSGDCRFICQGSLNQDITTDFPDEPGVHRESSNWPVLEGRLAVTLGQRGAGDHPIELGVSGHIGETGFDFLTTGPPPLNLPPQDDVRFLTWSVNVDVRVPLADYCGVQGELFLGENLSAFLGGIGQGVCSCTRLPIRSRGGWLEVWYDWCPAWHSHAGCGVDDPRDGDSLIGRTYNQFVFANLLMDLSSYLSAGIEATYWATYYHEERVGQIPANLLTPAAPGRAVTLEWIIQYKF